MKNKIILLQDLNSECKALRVHIYVEKLHENVLYFNVHLIMYKYFRESKGLYMKEQDSYLWQEISGLKYKNIRLC